MSTCVIIICLVITAIIAFRGYYKTTVKWCKSQTCLVGKTTIVTGANIGLGYQIALDFAKRGARVILACRSKEKAEEARSKIIEETGNENVIVKLIDMSSFKSIRAFVKDINETESRLDILVNNAGILHSENQRSEDGNVLILQVNYFSTFLLTLLLMDLMKKTKTSRIINVSSLLATLSRNFDVEKLHIYPGDTQGYPYSKLCQILFTIELAKRLQGTGITTYSVHPGGVKTNLFVDLTGYKAVVCYVLKNLFFITPEEGAQSVIYCSVAKGIEKDSGELFTNCCKSKRYRVACSPDLPQKLWEVSEKIVQLYSEKIKIL